MIRGKRLAAAIAVASGLLLGPAASGAWATGSSGYFTELSSAPAYLHGYGIAAPLPNGQVLIAGGVGDSDNVIQSAELFDPTSGAFTGLPQNSGTELTTPRAGAIAAPLPNGDVLIAGGVDASFNPLQSAELFNPIADTFQALSASGSSELQVARVYAVAAPLPDGDVLIAGGQNNSGCQQSAELFDPSNDSFTELPTTGSSRPQSCPTRATAATLPNGDVLIAGNGNNAQLFNPSTDSFTSLLTGSGIPADVSGSPLPDGQVLVAGGSSPPVQNAELFSPSSDTFTSLPASGSTEMQVARRGAVSAPLPNGDVLIADGFGTNDYITDTAELYVPPAEAQLSGGSFGDQTIAQPSAEQSLVVTNVGAQILRIAGAVIGASGNPGDFTIAGDACAGQALPFGHSCAITVGFTPGAAGTRSAALTLEDNEANPASVALSGTGVPANAGPVGPQGLQGLAGASGVGTAGPAGAPGPAGKNGQVELVTCTVVHRNGKRKRHCATQTIGGRATFTAAAADVPSTARAVLSRNGVTYASGTATHAGVTLHAARRVPRGGYTLTLTYRSGRSKIARHLKVRIG